jgi:hypothetical protein
MPPNDDPLAPPDTPAEGEQAQSWPALFGKLILDFSKVLEAEARLMRASIQPTLSAVLERWLWQLMVAGIALTGCMLLIGAAILLIHVWLAWWLAFGITGAATMLLALGLLLIR